MSDQLSPLSMADATEPHTSSRAAPAVAIILVNYNGWQDTIECLDTLLAMNYPAFHVFIVDNESQDDSCRKIAEWCAAPERRAGWPIFPGVEHRDGPAVEPLRLRSAERRDGTLDDPDPRCRVTLVRSGVNLGFAGGCNVGIRAAGLDRFDYFWMLNNDTVVDRTCLSALIERATQDTEIGLVGSTMVYYDRPDTVQTLAGAELFPRTMISRHIGEGTKLQRNRQRDDDVERRLTYIMGASMLASNRFVRVVGLMSEDYFLYYEEIDWAMRARGKFKLAYAPASLVYHKSGASSAKILEEFSARLYYKNRVRFTSRFFPRNLFKVRYSLCTELGRHLVHGRWVQALIVGQILRRFNEVARSPQALE